MRVLIIIAVVLATSAFGQATGGIPNMEDTGQPWGTGAPPPYIEPRTTYRDMGILDSIRLGIAPIVRPRDLKNASIGYRHAITEANRQAVCDRFERGQILIGIAAGTEIWIPHRASEADCRRTEGNGFNVFISSDGDNADLVISWQTHNNLGETWQENPSASE